jgi:hypothetical protein
VNPLLKAVIAVSTCPVCAAQHSPPPATDQLGRALAAPEVIICAACSEARYREAVQRLRRGEDHRVVKDDPAALRAYARSLPSARRRRKPDPAQRELFPAPPETHGPQGKGESPARLASHGLPHTGPDAGSVRADTPQPGGAGEETPEGLP